MVVVVVVVVMMMVVLVVVVVKVDPYLTLPVAPTVTRT